MTGLFNRVRIAEVLEGRDSCRPKSLAPVTRKSGREESRPSVPLPSRARPVRTPRWFACANCNGLVKVEMLSYRHPMKLRDWSLRRWLLMIALIILLPLIGLRLHLKWRVHRAVAKLRDAGHPTTYEELYRRQGVIEGAANMVNALTNAVRQSPELPVETRVQLPIIGEAKTPPAGTPWPESVATATQSYLSANQVALRNIHAAVAITNAWWWNTYHPEKWDINGISKAKRAAVYLSLEAAFLAQSGDTAGALRSTAPIFVIAEQLYGDPIMITHLVRFAIQASGLQRLEYVLGNGEPSAAGINQMREVLRRQIAQDSLTQLYQGELVFFLEAYFHRSHHAYINVALEPPAIGSFEDFKQRAIVLAYRVSGLADRDILYAIEANSEIASKAATLAGQIDLERNGSALLPSSRGLIFHYWSEQSLAIPIKIQKRSVETQMKLSVADAALAVAQYRLQHDARLPASLDELVPDFLETVPVEPQSGKPFELIVTPDGYGIGRGTPVFSVKLKSTPATALP